MKKESSSAVVFQTTLSFGALSDKGKVRDENQDRFLADPESGLFLVSDGVGGHQGGACASQTVVDALPAILDQKLTEAEDFDDGAIERILKTTILELSERVRKRGRSLKANEGIGATLVMALLRYGRAHIANMGDRRAYLFHESRLSQLTEDHNVVGLFLREGLISKTRASFKYHPGRHQLTRYIGMHERVHPYVCAVNLKAKDRLLLCSDGLTALVNDGEIAAILQEEIDPQIACEALVDTANAAGGYDNITAVIVDWHGPDIDNNGGG